MTAMWTSKLNNKFPRDLIDRLDSEHHRTLQRLRKEPANALCAECREGDTSWASVNLGVFVCLRCADVHRALGTHISKVKGCSGTYLWGPDEIARMQETGNAAAVAQFGGDCKEALPRQGASKEERVELCRRKYEQRCWAPAAGGRGPRVSGQQEGVSTPAGPADAAPARAPRIRSAVVGFSQHSSFEDTFGDFADTLQAAKTAEAGSRMRPAGDAKCSWFEDLFGDFDAPQPGKTAEDPHWPDVIVQPQTVVEVSAADTSTVASDDDIYGYTCLVDVQDGQSAPRLATASRPASAVASAVGLQQRVNDSNLWEGFGAW